MEESSLLRAGFKEAVRISSKHTREFFPVKCAIEDLSGDAGRVVGETGCAEDCAMDDIAIPYTLQ
jgi:hypothetical protein